MLKKFAMALLIGASCLTFQMNPVAAEEFEDLKNPHGGFFYIITKPVDVNIKQQMERAYNLIMEGKDYDMAVAVLDEVIKLDPNNSEAYMLRGLARTELKEYDKADKNYESAIKIEPNNPTFYYYRALNQIYKGYTDKEFYNYNWLAIGADNQSMKVKPCEQMALKYFKKAIELAPYYVDAIVGLGDNYCRIAEFDGNDKAKRVYAYRTAIGEYNKILVLFPNHQIVLTKKADAQQAMGNIEN